MMKAAVLAGPRQIVVKEVAVPEVHPGEIEIAVSACGVVTNPGDSSFKRHRTKLSARSNASADRELLYCYRENVSRETHWRIGQENSLEILFVEDILQAAGKAKCYNKP